MLIYSHFLNIQNPRNINIEKSHLKTKHPNTKKELTVAIPAPISPAPNTAMFWGIRSGFPKWFFSHACFPKKMLWRARLSSVIARSPKFCRKDCEQIYVDMICKFLKIRQIYNLKSDRFTPDLALPGVSS